MFTGLVSALGTVRSVSSMGTGRTVWIESPFTDLKLGESVCCDGVCMTVEDSVLGEGEKERGAFQVTAGEETLRRTTVSVFAPGFRVHLERALLPSDRLGGHFVTGHVDGIGTLSRVQRRPGFTEVEVEVPASLMIYFVEKGSVALDGVSLTVNTVGPTSLTVGIIPHTDAVTKFGNFEVGSTVNVEVDILARYVQRRIV